MKVEVKRIDHLGIVAGTIKDLGIIETIDSIIPNDKQEKITAGQVVAGMILNGLGFISKPLMLTPQFFENKALNLLIGENISAEYFNRHKIGRVFDNISKYGCEKLFNNIALKACEKEEVKLQFAHADTTTYSLSGEYETDIDAQKIKITHGYSKDKRSDLVQIVQEIVASQDGGIPIMCKTWSGNASDTVILRERIKAVVEEFAKFKKRIMIGDSKLYNSGNAEILNKIYFITRVPSTLKEEQIAINNAIALNKWIECENGYKIQEISSNCLDIQDQRWIIVHSQQAQDRAKKTIEKNQKKEYENIQKQLFHLQAKSFSCQEDAQAAIISMEKKWDYYRITEQKIVAYKKYSKRGRPMPNAPQAFEFRVEIKVGIDNSIMEKKLIHDSCFVLSTNVLQETLSSYDVLVNYKQQDKVEKGFAFIKSPEFFTSSLFLKKPERIEALLTIMVSSLLVYSIAQRKLRINLNLLKSTLPNQINQQTSTPTLRWIFQQFEGINLVKIYINETATILIEGLTEIRQKIISFFSPNVQMIYQKSFALG